MTLSVPESIACLRRLLANEARLETKDRSYASARDAAILRGSHHRNRQALDMAIAALTEAAKLPLEQYDDRIGRALSYAAYNAECERRAAFRREQDELVCANCGLRWSIDEVKPSCLIL